MVESSRDTGSAYVAVYSKSSWAAKTCKYTLKSLLRFIVNNTQSHRRLKSLKASKTV